MSAAAKSPALAVVVALWVNVAVQPCAMAFGTEADDCLHCPPAHEGSMAMMHGDHADATSNDCVSMSGACGEITEFGVDSRGSQSTPKDKADVVATLATWPQEPIDCGVGCSSSAADPPDPVSPPLPIHILNCVFLD